MDPDLIMACAGDVPTIETLAAVEILRHHFPQLKVRVVNVVDLMTLQPRNDHPHGMEEREYNAIFPPNTQVIFAFHGYASAIHKLIYKRENAACVHVHGYKEEGTTTTSFDMVVLNELDRYHLVGNAIDRLPQLKSQAAHVKQWLRDKLIEHRAYVVEHGIDTPEIRNWRWSLSDS